MDQFVRMPGYCDICGRVYQPNGIGLAGDVRDANFGNIILGTCPVDGGVIRGIPGRYDLIDGILNVKATSNIKELNAIIKVLKNVKAYESIEDVERKLSVVGEDYSLVIDFIKSIIAHPHIKNIHIAINIVLGLIAIAGFGLQVKDELTESTTDKNTTELVKIEKEKLKEKKKQTKILENIQCNNDEKRMPHLERKSKIKEKKKSKYKKGRK
ncbi:hypothetical protein AB4G91_01580 [Macrococcoides goetzii]|uniref:hypothetical protein n=1 Tax=Macrococcus sp. PK TaxID=2801919 RepID=UPI001F0D9838|nr:hypothetical protein [Macrococcus sp. PK]MCH4983988.1 hypothetical protein [Macrococcus sp. PK]